MALGCTYLNNRTNIQDSILILSISYTQRFLFSFTRSIIFLAFDVTQYTNVRYLSVLVRLASCSYKLVKIPSVCLSVSGCFANHGGTHRNRYTQRLVIFHADLLVNPDHTS